MKLSQSVAHTILESVKAKLRKTTTDFSHCRHLSASLTYGGQTHGKKTERTEFWLKQHKKYKLKAKLNTNKKSIC
jgi:hypothetical protein